MSVIHDSKNFTFTVEEGMLNAFLSYRIQNHTLYLMNTQVSEEARGKGWGGILMVEVLQYAESEKYQIAVLCPFARAYLKKFPKWEFLLDKSFHSNGL